MELSEDDVLHILKLIDESKFDYFQLEVGELKITVSKGDPIPIAGAAQPAPRAWRRLPAAAAVKPAPTTSTAPAAQAAKPVTIPEGMLADHSADARNILCCAGTGRSAVRQSRPANHRRYDRRIDRSDESFQQRARHR